MGLSWFLGSFLAYIHIYACVYKSPYQRRISKIYKKCIPRMYIKYIFLCIVQGWEGSRCLWFVPATHFPIRRVSGCHQRLGPLFLARAREEDAAAARRCCGDLGDVSEGCWGQSCPPPCRWRWAEPAPGGREIPSPETCLPHPIFLLLTPSGFGLGETSAAEKGWPRCPERRAATAPLRWGGDGSHPAPRSLCPSPIALPGSRGGREPPPAPQRGFAIPGAGP